MECLKELDLSRCQKLTDACVLHLISIQNLEKLSVAETSLTMDGVKQLSSLIKLSVLDLGGLPVTDMALSSLQGLTKLEYLDIWGSELSNNGTASLKAFGKLRFLNTAWTRVTKLPYLPSITCLNMSKCSVQSTFEEVHHNVTASHLEKLHLTGVTSTNANDIFSNINPKRLSFLDLSCSPLQNFEFLANMTSLQHLDLSSCGLKDDSIELIAQIGTTLKFLDLINTRLGSAAIAKTIILSETEVDDDVLLYIAMMPSLKVLDLSCNTNITGKGKCQILSLSTLQNLKHLEKLILDGTQHFSAALQPLALLEKLKFLSLQSDFISDESLHILSSFPKLENLGIRGAVLSDEGIHSFNPPPKLEILDLSDSWLLTKDAILLFRLYHPTIELRHKHVHLLSMAHIASSQGSPGHGTSRIVPSKSKWTKFSSVPPQIQKESFVDERLKYSREELLEMQKSPLSQISYLDSNIVLPDTV
ncbi:hypothetical protein ACHQM5_013875 [Ranunculus cassubicifolius]